METRRIRRLERRRSQRIIATTVALGAVGVAVGLALPRNPTASTLTLVLAVGALAAIALRADSAAPSHGLRHVVRLPIRSAVAASVASLSSRVVGTLRVMWRTTPSAVPDAEPHQRCAGLVGDATRSSHGGGVAGASPSEPERTEHAPAGVRREIERIRGSFARRLGARRMPDDRATSEVLEGSTVSTGSS